MPDLHLLAQRAAQRSCVLPRRSAQQETLHPRAGRAARGRRTQPRPRTLQLAAAPCLKCQHDGRPPATTTATAPNFLLAGERLKPDWTFRWLLDPQRIMPGTAMPSELFKHEGERWVFNGPLPPAAADYQGDHARLLVRYLLQLTPEEQARTARAQPAPSGAPSSAAVPPTPVASRGRQGERLGRRTPRHSVGEGTRRAERGAGTRSRQRGGRFQGSVSRRAGDAPFVATSGVVGAGARVISRLMFFAYHKAISPLRSSPIMTSSRARFFVALFAAPACSPSPSRAAVAPTTRRTWPATAAATKKPRPDALPPKGQRGLDRRHRQLLGATPAPRRSAWIQTRSARSRARARRRGHRVNGDKPRTSSSTSRRARSRQEHNGYRSPRRPRHAVDQKGCRYVRTSSASRPSRPSRPNSDATLDNVNVDAKLNGKFNQGQGNGAPPMSSSSRAPRRSNRQVQPSNPGCAPTSGC